jgi:IS4 transposase
MGIQKANIPFITQILSLISRDGFRALVDKHGSDCHAKGYDSWTQLLTMIFAQLSGAESLRDVQGGIATAPGRFKELFLNMIPTKSTIAYNNANRPWELFEEAFLMVMNSLKEKMPKQPTIFAFLNPLLSLDSTTISLSLSVFDWARYRTAKGGVKIHTVYNNKSSMPELVNVTEAAEHDIKAARSLILPKGSIVAIDRGYVDYALFSKWTEEGIYFVSRPKVSISCVVIEDRELPRPVGRPKLVKNEPVSDQTEDEKITSETADTEEAGSEQIDENQPASGRKLNNKPKKQANVSKKVNTGKGKAQQKRAYKAERPQPQIIKDQIIKLKTPSALAACPHELRLVSIYDPEKKCNMTFITNQLAFSPRTIALIYRDRWEVEIFFKNIKQEVLVKSFLGTSANALKIQVYTAMIAICLVRYLQLLPKQLSWNLSNLIHLLRLNWFTYQNLFQWIEVPHCEKRPPPEDAPRIQFNQLF